MRNPNRTFFSLLMILASCTFKSAPLRFQDGNRNSNPTTVTDDHYPLKLELAPRSYVHSVLLQVFSIEEATFQFEYNALKNRFSKSNVLFNEELGGGCDPYAESEKVTSNGFDSEFPDDSCIQSLPINIDAVSTPSRFAVINSICDFLIQRDTMTYTALRKVRPGWSNAISEDPTEIDAIAIYRLFLPDEVPSSIVVSELMKVSASGSTPKDRWKNLLYFICILPDWHDLR